MKKRCCDKRRCCDRRKATIEEKDATKEEGDEVEPCQKACRGAMVIKIVGMRSVRAGGSYTYEGIFVS